MHATAANRTSHHHMRRARPSCVVRRAHPPTSSACWVRFFKRFPSFFNSGEIASWYAPQKTCSFPKKARRQKRSIASLCNESPQRTPVLESSLRFVSRLCGESCERMKKFSHVSQGNNCPSELGLYLYVLDAIEARLCVSRRSCPTDMLFAGVRGDDKVIRPTWFLG